MIKKVLLSMALVVATVLPSSTAHASIETVGQVQDLRAGDAGQVAAADRAGRGIPRWPHPE
jgi:hypothetical protein